jgi:hypothetical protein
MKLEEKNRFGLALAALAANFRAELTEAQLRITWLALKDELTLSQFETAAARALRELEWMPAVGKLLELAGKKRGGPAGKLRIIDGKPWTWLGETGWGRYYGSVREAARSVGLDPESAGDILGRMLPPPPPDRRLPREREDDDEAT